MLSTCQVGVLLKTWMTWIHKKHDYSRKTWVYFFKENSNVFSCFKKFKILVQKKNSYFIKSLRMDKGWILF